jgi:hypothetical protein
MPIGPITPGSFVTVTPDVIGVAYASLQAPTATMPVVGSDIQALTLVLLSIQDYVLAQLVATAATKLDKIAGGTVSGPTIFSGTVDFQAVGASRPVYQGGLRIVAGGQVITAGDLTLSNGSLSVSNDLVVGDDALVAGDFSAAGIHTIPVGGRLNLLGSVTLRPAIAVTDAVHSVGKTSGSALAPNGADTIIVPPAILSADRDFTVRSAGAEAGNRMRFYSADNAFYLHLKQDDGTSIVQLKSGSLAPAFGFWKWIELEHTGAANGWFPVGGQAG